MSIQEQFWAKTTPWKEAKKRRIEHYINFVHGWKERPCRACNGSGYYDHNGIPPCSACNGTGKEKYPGPKSCKYKGD